MIVRKDPIEIQEKKLARIKRKEIGKRVRWDLNPRPQLSTAYLKVAALERELNCSKRFSGMWTKFVSILPPRREAVERYDNRLRWDSREKKLQN
jgi:hypothetical protein